MKTIKILFALTKEIKRLFLVILLTILFGFLGFIAAMALPILGVLLVLNVSTQAIPIPILIIGLLFAGILRGFFRYFEHYTGHYVAFKILAIFRDKIFRKMRELSPAKLDSKKTGDLISIITGDVETLEVFYAHTLAPIAIAFLTSVLHIVIQSVFIHPYIGLQLIVIYLWIGIGLPILLHLIIKKTSFLFRKSLNDYTNSFVDGVMGIKSLIAYSQLDDFLNSTHSLAVNVQKETENMSLKQAKNQFIIDISIKLSILAFLGITGFMWWSQTISSSNFILSIIMMISSFGPLIALANLPNNLNQTIVSGERILTLLNEEAINFENTDDMSVEIDRFIMKEVSFSYSLDNHVLNGVNLEGNSNDIIGIYGPSGIGKSTILKLLMYIYTANKGYIDFNDTHLEDINTTLLRDHLGLVMQSTYVFNKSIRDNIDLCHKYTDNEIKEACEASGIMSLISTLPEGLETMIGEKHRQLSLGEKQRIGLARIFLRQSRFLLLDEPTSNLDYYNESIILSSIVKMSKEKTVVIVSHKRSTLNICNKIYHLDNQKLVLEKS
jgi:ATP-binding cassette, subfamily C, bacterial